MRRRNDRDGDDLLKGTTESTNNYSRRYEMKEAEEQEDLPLLDEINDLLVKERTLLGLKVVEQQIEAQEWKVKYEKLVNKLSENVTDMEIFELVSDLDSTNPSLDRNFDYYLQLQANLPSATFASSAPSGPSSGHCYWCLDVSKISLQRLELKKLLNYPKSHSNENIRILQLSSCEIQDKDADLVVLLLHYPRLVALDLSFNQLGTEFHARFLQSIERRRLYLQYLLLDGNMSLSLLSLENLAHHLSSHTWGIKVTLNDLENLTQYENVDRKKQSKKKTQTKLMTQHTSVPDLSLPLNISYTVRLCARFLRHLNFVLGADTEGIGPRTASVIPSAPKKKSDTLGQSSLGKVKKDLTEGFSDVVKKHQHRGQDKGEGGLQFLCVFGLTHAKLCKDSLSLLQHTLELSIGSLTDLDLTFAFTGITGAEIISTTLRHRHCQLIRLGLLGNSFGDHGADLLSHSIEETTTLTYLDLRSNDITDKGLARLTLSVMRHRILQSLVIDNNSFDPNFALDCQQRIQFSGSQTQLKWTNHFGLMIDARDSETTAATPSQSSSIFTLTSQVSVPIDPVTRNARLYSIASHLIRPLSRQFHGTSQSLGVATGINEPEADPSTEFILLKWTMGLSLLQSEASNLHEKLSKTRLSWEVKCITGSKVVTFAKRVLEPNACLPIGQRVKCAAAVPCPPMYSYLEVWVTVVSSDVKIGSRIHSTEVTSRKSLRYGVEGGLHMDSSQFEISRPAIYGQPEEFIFISGDQRELSSVENSLISLYDPFESQPFHQFHHLPPSFCNASLPEGFSVGRHLRWSGQPVGHGRIQFKMRLSASHGFKREESGDRFNETEGVRNNTTRLVHEPSWRTTEAEDREGAGKQRGGERGYEWAVMRCRHSGIGSHLLDGWYEIVGQGTHLDNAENLSLPPHPVESSLLDPWLWKPFEVPVENILLNDSFLLLYRLTSSSSSDGNMIVSVSDWGISLIGESFLGWEEMLDEESNGNILNAVWDDPCLSISL